MNVLLVQNKARGRIAFPLNLLYLASVAEKGGHKVKILDLQVEDIGRFLDSFRPEIVGITVYSYTFKECEKTASYIKGRLPEVPIIAGGIHATTMPEEFFEKKLQVDFVAIGEGEETFKEFLENYPEKLKEVNGLLFREKNKLFRTPLRPPISDLDSLPPLDFGLVDFSRYAGFAYVLGSRGCHHQCTFCCVPQVYGKKIRLRSPEKVVEEIEQLTENFEVKRVKFADADIAAVLPWFEKLLLEIRNQKVKAEFFSETRVDSLKQFNTTHFELMKEAGFDRIYVGVENFSQKILDYYEKGFKAKDALPVLKNCIDNGIIPVAYIILISPADTLDTIGENLDGIAELVELGGFVFVNENVIPLPGTVLRERVDGRQLELWIDGVSKKPFILSDEKADAFFDLVLKEENSKELERMHVLLSKAVDDKDYASAKKHNL
ncbi:MAG: radical SAM protein, partial [Candidatus Diapherotrites archaeon]